MAFIMIVNIIMDERRITEKQMIGSLSAKGLAKVSVC
jgi:hypothetical protein